MLLQVRQEQHGVDILAVQDAKTVSGQFPELPCLPLSKPAIAGGPENFCQFAELGSGELFRCRIILQYGESGLAENRIKLCLKLWKYLVQQCGNLPFEIADQVHEVEAVPAQLPQRQQVLLGYAAGLIASKTDRLRNEQSVNGIGLGLSDKQFPHGVGLERIENNSLPAIFAQPCVKRQPVVSGGFHSEDEFAFVIRDFA